MYGNVEVLEKKYGKLKESNFVFNFDSNPINMNASFQKKPLKINLPLIPELEIKPIIVKDEIVKDEKGEKLADVLSFIDVTKLDPGRAGAKTKYYSLIDLTELTRLLNIVKARPNKKNLITDINEELKKIFGDQPNLIGQIRKYKTITINELSNLFNENNISITTTNKLIKMIKSKHGNDVPIDKVIDLIELEWLPITIK